MSALSAVRIIACVPADYDDVLRAWIPPAAPLQLRLYRHAIRKQQHVCRAATVSPRCSAALASRSPLPCLSALTELAKPVEMPCLCCGKALTAPAPAPTKQTAPLCSRKF